MTHQGLAKEVFGALSAFTGFAALHANLRTRWQTSLVKESVCRVFMIVISVASVCLLFTVRAEIVP